MASVSECYCEIMRPAWVFFFDNDLLCFWGAKTFHALVMSVPNQITLEHMLLFHL